MQPKLPFSSPHPNSITSLTHMESVISHNASSCFKLPSPISLNNAIVWLLIFHSVFAHLVFLPLGKHLSFIFVHFDFLIYSLALQFN